MSVSGSDNAERLAPRVVRVRNGCLKALAARRSLPTPGDAELTTIDDAVGLRAAWERYEKTHTPPTGTAEVAGSPTRPRVIRWRSRRVVRDAAVAAAGLLGVVAGGLWRQRIAAQGSAPVAEQQWLAVDDSVVRSMNARLVARSRTDESSTFTLSAADLATMIFRSPRRRFVPVDSLEARLDGLLWIRGRLRGASRFELGGDVRVVRRGLAELRVTHWSVNGVATDSTLVTRLVAGSRARSSDVDRLRFDVPAFVSSIVISGGAAEIVSRER
jgi:hypothetical protein